MAIVKEEHRAEPFPTLRRTAAANRDTLKGERTEGLVRLAQAGGRAPLFSPTTNSQAPSPALSANPNIDQSKRALFQSKFTRQVGNICFTAPMDQNTADQLAKNLTVNHYNGEKLFYDNLATVVATSKEAKAAGITLFPYVNHEGKFIKPTRSNIIIKQGNEAFSIAGTHSQFAAIDQYNNDTSKKYRVVGFTPVDIGQGTLAVLLQDKSSRQAALVFLQYNGGSLEKESVRNKDDGNTYAGLSSNGHKDFKRAWQEQLMKVIQKL